MISKVRRMRVDLAEPSLDTHEIEDVTPASKTRRIPAILSDVPAIP